MGSKAILVVWLALLAVVLLLSSEVAAARDLAETTKTTHQSSESANKLEDAKYGGYPGGGYPGHGGGGYPGHGGGGGGYPGHGGGGGGYPGHGGGGGCHYGCCGHGYYGHCKCCASADEAAAQAAATTQP